MTKQVTAVLVLQQVAQGRISLDSRLADVLPAFKGPTASGISVRMLLQHTSGLPNPDDTAAADAATMPAFYVRAAPDPDANDAVGYCAGTPKAKPGAGFRYDNCDFIVLGAILERLTGRSFAVLVHEQIAAKLRLTSLRLAEPEAEPLTVRGFVGPGKPEPDFHLWSFGASGALVGTAADLLSFDRGLLTNALLDPKARSVGWQGDPKLGYVALGVWGFPARLKGCDGAMTLVERRGEIGGVEVRNLIAPETGRALVVFADRSDLDFGEIWRGQGLSHDLASAAFCG